MNFEGRIKHELISKPIRGYFVYHTSDAYVFLPVHGTVILYIPPKMTLTFQSDFVNEFDGPL